MGWYRFHSRREADRRREEEMSSHIGLYVEEAMARGRSEDTARREARLKFGNPRAKREAVDDLSRIPFVESFIADLRTAVRSLRAAPGFTITVLVVLTLAMGATTAVFSIVDAVVLRPMPFDRQERIVVLGHLFQDHWTTSPLAAPQFLALRSQPDLFESLAAVTDGGISLRRDGAREAEVLRGQRVTADFFKVLRIAPALGRAFGQDDEADGRDRVVVISAALWQRRFDRDPAIVGRSLAGADGAWQVIGVMPDDFAYPVGATRPTEVWRPYVVPENERTGPPHSNYLQVVARLRDDATLEGTQAALDAVVASRSKPSRDAVFNGALALDTLQDAVTGRERVWALMVMAAVVCVLLIASVNIANLMLVRATVRVMELGVRSALGASTWQIVRMLLAESLLLSLTGMALGLFVAWWGLDALHATLPASLPRVGDVAMNTRVFGAAAAVGIFTGVLFALAPAWRSRRALDHVLKQDARGFTSSGRRQWTRSLFLTTQIALAVVLALGAILFLSSFARLMRIDLGLDYRSVTMMDVRPAPGTATVEKFARILDRLDALPGVEAAAVATSNIPFSLSRSMRGFVPPGGTGMEGLQVTAVSPEYFRTLRVAVRAGRSFAPRDGPGADEVVILNELAARTFFPDGNALGQSLNVGRPRTIVGIVADFRGFEPERAPDAAAFVPFAQDGGTAGTLIIRSSGPARVTSSQLKAAVLGEFPDLIPAEPRLLETSFDALIAQRRFNMLLLGLFGVLGITIAAVGIFGVTSYTVAQRTREIGIRMALGAVSASILWAVLKRASLHVTLGLVIGLGLAWMLSKSVASFLFRVQPHEPHLYLVVAGILALTAIAAAAIPARRATRVDPVVALRVE